MSAPRELKRLINPRALYLARGRAEPTRPAQILLRMTLVLVLLGLFAAILSHLASA